MKIAYHNVSCLDVEDLIQREMPYTNELYSNMEWLKSDVDEQFSFYTENKNYLPVYQIKEDKADNILNAMSDYYKMAYSAVGKLLRLPENQIRKWVPCNASNHPGFVNFLEYAKYTYENDEFGIYGRLDTVVNPETDEIEGVYEINGDTPVMLFESVNLQNLISELLGNPDAQANDWWDNTVSRLQALKGKTVAVVCDTNAIEDTLTIETLSQAFHAAGVEVYFDDLKNLNHDVLDLEKPFSLDSVYSKLDVVFVLSPWEEMWVSGADILVHWKKWCNNVLFLEPAWRWFMSNKGLLAYITYLLENDISFKEEWGNVKHLRTYLSPDLFKKENVPYVSKPTIGRLSQNVTIHLSDEDVLESDGYYGDEPLVYQEYLKPYTMEGRGSFIACGWISKFEACTLCFREFDGKILELGNERFVSHQLI